MKKKEEKQIHNKNIMDAFYHAGNGIIHTTKTEPNMKRHLLIAMLVLILSLFFGLSNTEFLCLLFAIFFVLFAELVNTAIEAVVDLYIDQYHPKAKIAKDVGAGAVIIAALNAIIVAYFLFFDKIVTVGHRLLQDFTTSPLHIAVVGIAFILITILALKATKPSKETLLPDGKVMLGFALLTLVWINTDNMIVFASALLLSLLLINKENMKDTKSKVELTFSCLMGILIMLLIYGLIIVKF